MEEPKSLNSLFKEKVFRIPDYQRGYAWQRAQLKDFWEDLVNLSDGRFHYTGVLTLKQIPTQEINENDKEYWLVEDHSYNLYHIVDGQQRLATFIILLKAFVDCLKNLPDNKGKADDEIYITDRWSVADLQKKYLFKTKPTGDQYRTYKFGYMTGNLLHAQFEQCETLFHGAVQRVTRVRWPEGITRHLQEVDKAVHLQRIHN